MKNKLILTLVIMITVLGISFGQSKSRNLKVVIKTNIYCSHCKECESCGGRLTAGFAKIKGVKKYDLDDKKMNISVTFEPALVFYFQLFLSLVEKRKHFFSIFIFKINLS